jgi:hypothetical protein
MGWGGTVPWGGRKRCPPVARSPPNRPPLATSSCVRSTVVPQGRGSAPSLPLLADPGPRAPCTPSCSCPAAGCGACGAGVAVGDPSGGSPAGGASCWLMLGFPAKFGSDCQRIGGGISQLHGPPGRGFRNHAVCVQRSRMVLAMYPPGDWKPPIVHRGWWRGARGGVHCRPISCQHSWAGVCRNPSCALINTCVSVTMQMCDWPS